MTACPDDRELLELVDGELAPPRAAHVVEHLAECAACRVALGRAEAALTYALGGLSDSGRWNAVDAQLTANGPPPQRRGRLFTIAGATLAVTAATLVAAVVLRASPPHTSGHETAAQRTPADAATRAELSRLLARAEQLRDAADAPDGGRDLVAEGALAAAEARAWTLGPVAARAHVENVIERFPGTSAARQARALLASAAWSERR